MTPPTDTLPITDTIRPQSSADICQCVIEAAAAASAIYPIGGGTSLDYGLPARAPGTALCLTNLTRVVDYPARDMTITVEAGITMSELTKTLATEKQRLPIDVPDAETATLGGVIATNWNGPRRYGQGTVRDYVIGISAVDGHGTLFKGGGRVVKNVAGYDFCKLLTGSLGTLGVITQVTLKVRPVPEKSVILTFSVSDMEVLASALSALVHSQTTPSAIEVVFGPEWEENHRSAQADGWSQLVVALEGSEPEVNWMVRQLQSEMQQFDLTVTNEVADQAATSLWHDLANWSAVGEAPLVLKVSVLPSGVPKMIAALRTMDAKCSLQSHAGNGIILAKLSKFPDEGLSRALVSHLQPMATSLGGNIVVLSNPSGAEITHQSVWGGIDAPFALMSKIKQQFDPKNILNPGRFVYV